MAGDSQHWGCGGLTQGSPGRNSPGRSLSCHKCPLLPLQSRFPDSRGALASQRKRRHRGGRKGALGEVKGTGNQTDLRSHPRTVGFLGSAGAGFSLPQTQGNPQLTVHPDVAWGRTYHGYGCAAFPTCCRVCDVQLLSLGFGRTMQPTSMYLLVLE